VSELLSGPLGVVLLVWLLAGLGVAKYGDTMDIPHWVKVVIGLPLVIVVLGCVVYVVAGAWR